jgi:hypothetical protein
LLARLRAEVARQAAAPAERVLDEALKLLLAPSAVGMVGAGASRTARAPSPPAPGALAASTQKDARVAAARARLRSAVSGRGAGGPDPLAAAVRAVRVGSAGTGRGDANPLAWEGSGEAVPAAALVAEAGVLVGAVREQVATLSAAVAR